MRFLHTADWHLGRLFHGVNLTEDQHHVLRQIVDLVRAEHLDAVIVAGDVYDRAVPPADAVELLDWVLGELVLSVRVPVILIAGNHDSPRRLDFLRRLLAAESLYISGFPSCEAAPVLLGDDTGRVSFHPIAYADPAAARQALERDDIHDQDAALCALVTRSLEKAPAEARKVLVAHAFAAGGEASESERPLSVGGSFAVGMDCFSGFDYAALGHLHRPQSVGRDTVRYSGSLLKYSFSEAGHRKSVDIVELGATGACRVESIPLAPRRDLRIVEGLLTNLLDGPRKGESAEDYLAVRLLDEGVIFDAMGKLREVYPNVLHIERPVLAQSGAAGEARVDHRKMDEKEIFNAFFHEVTGNDLTPAQVGAFMTALERLEHCEREAQP